MEPEGSLLCLQKRIPGPYTELIFSAADHHTLSL